MGVIKGHGPTPQPAPPVTLGIIKPIVRFVIFNRGQYLDDFSCRSMGQKKQSAGEFCCSLHTSTNAF